jgi:tetratricopeptide (TPR) repeat protein
VNKPPKPEDSKEVQQRPQSLRDKYLIDPLADLMSRARKPSPRSDEGSSELTDEQGDDRGLQRSEEPSPDGSPSADSSSLGGGFDLDLNDSVDPFVDARKQAPSREEAPTAPPDDEDDQQKKEKKEKKKSEEDSARRMAFAEQFLDKSGSTKSKREPKTRDLIKAVMPMRLHTGRFQKRLINALACLVVVLCGLVGWKLANRPTSTPIGASLVGDNQPEDFDEQTQPETTETQKAAMEAKPAEDSGPKENTAAFFFGKGVIEHTQGKLARAEHFFRKALDVDERHPGATAGLASVLVADGFLEEAQGVLQDLEEFLPNDALIELNRGLVEYQLGNVTAAQERLRHFLSLTPEGKHAHDVKLILTHLFKKSEP